MSNAFSIRLEPEDLEERFRLDALERDRTQAVVVLALVVVIITGFIALDLRLLQSSVALQIATASRCVAAIVALVASIVFFLFGGPQPRKVYVALGLVAAGACGNLYDRIFNGGFVRDFIDVYYRNYHWPTFNVADSLLCIGVVIIMLPLIWEVFIRKPAQTHAQQQK